MKTIKNKPFIRAPKFVCALMLILLVSSMIGTTVWAATQPSEKIPVIIGFKDKTDASLIGKHGGDVKYQYSTISAIACSLPQGAIDALERNPRIAYIELDGKVQMTQEDPMWWSMPFDGVDRIDADLVARAHESSITGAGVKVAILDTGIDYNHPDLVLNYKGGSNFVNDEDPMDDNGHGTHVAGIVAAGDNGFGVIGVAPQASLYAVKVLDETGSGDVSDVIEGIQWSIDNGMDIISMSLGSTKGNQALHDICDAAYTAGILVVASAGNRFDMRGKRELDTVVYPARYASVIAVGATDKTDTRASYSSTGSALELVAPGENIYSTFLDDNYVVGGGTSMACPHVSGTAALILSGGTGLSASDVRNRLRDTADDLGSPRLDSWYGYGLVDANAMPGAPSITKLTPAVGAFINTATPTISAIVTDADGINAHSIEMTLDGPTVTPTYDPSTGLVYYVPESLDQGLHTATLGVSDTDGNDDVTSWSFTVDTKAPLQVTGVTVDPISSSSLFISWDANPDPHLAEYTVYRKAPGEMEHTHHIWVCTYSEGDRAGFFPDTGLEPNVNYSYQITAWDMAGNEGKPSISVSGTTTPTPTTGEMHVDRLLLDWRYGSGTNRKNTVVFAEAMIVIVDSGGVPVPGATVSGQWEDATTDGVTNDMGIVRLRSDTIRNPTDGTTFTFAVGDVVLSGWAYKPELNVETGGSITYP